MSKDMVLTCVGCGKKFTFTAEEQRFFEERGFENTPKRCPDCRRERRHARRAARIARRNGVQEMHDAVCSKCGKETQVPFEPTEGKPVYCAECFKAIMAERRAGKTAVK